MSASPEHFLRADEAYAVTCPRCDDDKTLHDQSCYPGALCWRCGARLVGHFTCVGCKVRRSADQGGAGDDLLSVACDYCVVATWLSLAATGRAIAASQARGGT